MPAKEKEDVKSVVISLLFFIALALFFRASALAAYKIPSGSMKDTLKIGDHIFVNKLAYGFRLPFMENTLFNYSLPSREDIVVFTLPEPDDPSIDIIKRVIGLPGDTVEVRGTDLYINGEKYLDDERYAVWREGGIKNFGPVEIPEDHIFLLGDNRDKSRDARYWENPFLHKSRIVGEAFIIWWNMNNPLDRMFKVISYRDVEPEGNRGRLS